MTTQSLTTVALDIAARYHEAGNAIGSAYRAGVSRTARMLDDRFATAVRDRSLPLVDASVQQSLIDAQQQVSGAIVGGLVAGSERACALRARLHDGVKSGIERLADNAETSPLKTLTQSWAAMTLPSAQFSLAVANAIADGAKRIDERVATPVAEAVEATTVDAEPAAPARRRAAKR